VETAGAGRDALGLNADVFNATLTERIDLTDVVARFVVEPDDGPDPFEPGQYMTLGLLDGDMLLQRPYSTASPKGASRHHEFLIRRVPGGTLTPLLWTVPVGGRVRIGRPKGQFVLTPGDERTLLFVATGTGLAPFMSMLRTLLESPRPPRAVVVHGVSHQGELGYRDRLEHWEREGRPVTYRPSVSRPDDPSNAGWKGLVGRVPEILDEACDARGLTPGATVAYLCGNPEMIASSQQILRGRGFGPEGIRTEQYWVAGRPRLAGAAGT
jgi:ferredoxin--NADP+ reductase